MPAYTLRRLPRSLLLESAFTPGGPVLPRANGGALPFAPQTAPRENRLWGANVDEDENWNQKLPANWTVADVGRPRTLGFLILVPRFESWRGYHRKFPANEGAARNSSDVAVGECSQKCSLEIRGHRNRSWLWSRVKRVIIKEHSKTLNKDSYYAGCPSRLVD